MPGIEPSTIALEVKHKCHVLQGHLLSNRKIKILITCFTQFTLFFCNILFYFLYLYLSKNSVSIIKKRFKKT